MENPETWDVLEQQLSLLLDDFRTDERIGTSLVGTLAAFIRGRESYLKTELISDLRMTT